MASSTICFIDTEWTALDLERGEVWEVALIIPGKDDERYVWHLWPQHLNTADPFSLKMSGFHARFGEASKVGPVDEADFEVVNEFIGGKVITTFLSWAAQFVELTAGRQLVGLTPEGDAVRLDRLVRRWGQCPMWHYQTIDAEVLAVGRLMGNVHSWGFGNPECERLIPLCQPPWDTDDISRAVGVQVPRDAHTALVDAMQAQDIYNAVMEPREEDR